jgi:hypothetical protein
MFFFFIYSIESNLSLYEILARFFTSTVLMDKLSKDKTSEDVVQKPPPSYQELFGEPNTSDNVQSQPIYNIKSHITWSILNILFCCWCFGCVACCFSMKTKELRERGDIQGASKASTAARQWNMLSTAFGITITIITIFFYALFISNQHFG